MSTMSFEITGGSGPPAGVYKVRFAAVEPTEHEEYGAGLKFVFDVLAPAEHAGIQATRITGTRPTPGNAAGKMIAAISGTSLKPGIKVDLAPYVGMEYLAQVEDTKAGNSTRVASVIRSQDQSSGAF